MPWKKLRTAGWPATANMQPMNNEPIKTVQIHFANQAAAEHFIHWLAGSGEQAYWQWMECREEEEKGNITAFRFNYWHDQTQFANNLEIHTECGRIDAGYKAV